MPARILISFSLLALWANAALATSSLSQQVPALSNSCNTCHTDGPASPRNLFGQQVEENLDDEGSIIWADLCALDADGDGSENGAELGDPCCTFEAGQITMLTLTDPSNGNEVSENTCTSEVPEAWTCRPDVYNDGESCDCGCGVLDSDCSSNAFSACVFDGCQDGQRVDVIDPTQCLNADDPGQWLCTNASYIDGICDCGCGAEDPSCAANDAALCETNGCANGPSPDPADVTQCQASLDGEWTCERDWFAANDGCDCGCGSVDPDCGENFGIASCTSSACLEQQVLNLEDLSQCIDNNPPQEWRCDVQLYASQGECDCGCGAPDPDCTTQAMASCDTSACGDDEVLAADDVAQCAAPAKANCSQGAGQSSVGFFVLLIFIVFLNRRSEKEFVYEGL